MNVRLRVLQYNVCWECIENKGARANRRNRHAALHCAVPERCLHGVLRTVVFKEYDLMGFQELGVAVLETFKRAVEAHHPRGEHVWIHRRHGRNENACLVFSGARFERVGPLVERGIHVRRTSPWHRNYAHARIVLAQCLVDRISGRRFLFAVVHMAHHPHVSMLSVRRMLDTLRRDARATRIPLVCAGDFNIPFPSKEFGEYVATNTQRSCCVDGVDMGNVDQVVVTQSVRDARTTAVVSGASDHRPLDSKITL